VTNEYDVIVVGAGTGGYVAAIRAAQLGLTVAVVEKQSALGGTCLLWGCIPTKALLEHAHALKVVEHAKEWGISIGEAAVTINMSQVQDRKNRIVSGITRGIEYLFKKNKIDWIKGTARLTGNGGVDVFEGSTQTLRARRAAYPAFRSTTRVSSRAMTQYI
jgi:dihydrolipoamide dehydrogenase